jgi:hypothetical protein
MFTVTIDGRDAVPGYLSERAALSARQYIATQFPRNTVEVRREGDDWGHFHIL